MSAHPPPYSYVVTSQPPSIVTHSAVGYFTSATQPNLILAKVHRLEIHAITPEGLQPLFDVAINGRVAALQCIRLKGGAKDTLLFTTERLQFVAVTFDEKSRVIKTVATGDLRDRIGRQIDRGQIFSVDPLARVVGMQFYEGHLKIVPSDRGFREKAFNVLLSEFAVRDLAFVQPLRAGTAASSAKAASSSSLAAAAAEAPPTIAVLYEDEMAPGRVYVNAYEVDVKERILRTALPRPAGGGRLDGTASLLVPVPAPLGGVLVLGRAAATYLSLEEGEGAGGSGGSGRGGGGRGGGGGAAGAGSTGGKRPASASGSGGHGDWSSSSLDGAEETVRFPAPIAPRAAARIDARRYLVADAAGGLFLLALHTRTPAQEEQDALSAGGAAARKRARGPGLSAMETEEDGEEDAAGSAAGAALADAIGGGGRGDGGSAGAGARVTGLSWFPLGVTVQASTVEYLGHGLVFLGSAAGDPTLIRLLPGDGAATAAAKAAAAPAAAGAAAAPLFEVVSSFSSLGPIVDLCAVDLDRQGQCQVVAASGMHRDGSLRVVRNGIGIEEQAVVDLPGITGLWSLKPGGGGGAGATAAAGGSSGGEEEADKYIVQSYAAATRVLALEAEGEMAEVEADGELAPGFDLSRPTLAAGNMAGGLLLQVTPEEARLARLHAAGDGGGGSAAAAAGAALVASWAPAGALAGRRITVAAATATHVLVALAGGTLVLLQLQAAAAAAGAALLVAVAQVAMPHEVSCLDLGAALQLGGGAAADTGGGGLAAVGLWTDASVRLLRLPTLAEAAPRVALGGEIQARSVLLATLEGGAHYLFAGLGDGHLFNFRLAAQQPPAEGGGGEGGGVEVSERKRVALGTQPVTLSSFASKGARHVFAACDRPAVLYSSARKLLYSNVNQAQVTYMAAFHSPALPHCLALASPGALTLGTVDDIQKLHVRRVPLGEQPRRVAHHRASRCVAVATEGVATAAGAGGSAAAASAAGGGEGGGAAAAFIRLFDDSTFDRLASFELDPAEITLSLASVRLGGAGAGGGAASSGSAAAAAEAEAAEAAEVAEPEAEYLVVGTAFVLEGEEEPSRGRVLVLAVRGGEADGPDRSLALVAARDVRGGVFALAPLAGGRLVAGINSKVQVYAWGRGPAAGSSGGLGAAASGHGSKAKAPAAAGASDASSSAAAVGASAGAAAARQQPQQPCLVPECGFAGSTLALFLDTRGDFVLVGDMMKSVSLLRYRPGDAALEELAAEPSCNWMTAVAMLDETAAVGAEHHYNLFSTVRRHVGPPADGQSFLDVAGEFHLGDMVNRFVPGSLVMLPAAAAEEGSEGEAAGGGDDAADDGGGAGRAAKRQRRDVGTAAAAAGSGAGGAAMALDEEPSSASAAAAPARRRRAAAAAPVPRPRLIFGTAGGSIGALITLPPPLYRYLVSVQRALNLVLHGVGGLSHAHWRSWHTDRRVPSAAAVGGELPAPRGFVDGDLVEMFLDLDRASQDRVVAALNGMRADGATLPAGGDVDTPAMHPDGSAGGGAATTEELTKVIEDLSRLH